MRVLCATGHRFSVTTWLVIPALFVATVGGVAGVPMAVLGGPVRLYAAIFGAAAAVAAVTSGGVRFRPWQRRWLRWPCVVTVALLGVALDGVTVPAYLAILAGLPAALTLLHLLRTPGDDDCSPPPRTPHRERTPHHLTPTS